MRHLIVAALLSLPGTAFAHAILVDSQPAAQSSVAPGSTPIVLRFNSRVDHARSRLVLHGGPAEVTLPVLPDSAADQLAARADLAPGPYTLRWQVLAIDGHITRGEVPFTVQAR